MNRKALILDAGGVLVHPLHGDWNIPARYRELLGAYARDIPGEAFRAACRAEAALLREDISIADIGVEYEKRLQFLKNVAARMGWALGGDQLKALAEDFTFNPDRYAWYADTGAQLAQWKGRVPLGMLSDAMPSFRRLVQARGLEEIFDAVVISTEIGVAKPDPKMYLEICRRMNLTPGDCLFVDDREGNLHGAMRCGMAAVQMCRDGLPAWDGPWVRDLAELNAYWEGLD